MEGFSFFLGEKINKRTQTSRGLQHEYGQQISLGEHNLQVCSLIDQREVENIITGQARLSKAKMVIVEELNNLSAEPERLRYVMTEPERLPYWMTAANTYKQYVVQIYVCSEHPDRKATCQCNYCFKQNLCGASFHCSRQCFMDSWPRHLELHPHFNNLNANGTFKPFDINFNLHFTSIYKSIVGVDANSMLLLNPWSINGNPSWVVWTGPAIISQLRPMISLQPIPNLAFTT